jgi:hypothetical protein
MTYHQDQDPIYTVVYRTGGTHQCKWHKTLVATKDEAEAAQVLDEIKTQGYHGFVTTKYLLDVVGLPIGWTAESVDFEKDYVKITESYTEHRKEYVPC